MVVRFFLGIGWLGLGVVRCGLADEFQNGIVPEWER